MKEFAPNDPYAEIQSFSVSPQGDTLFTSQSNWVIVSGISLANYSEDNCPKNLPMPQLILVDSAEYSISSGDYVRYYLSVENFAAFTDLMFEAASDLEPIGLNDNSARSWVDIYDISTDVRYIGTW